MTIDWKNDLRTNGYAVFPGLLPEGLAHKAFDAIETDLRENFDASQQSAYDDQSYCPSLKGTRPIMDLLTNKPVSHLLDAALGIENIGWDGGQIAIRRAHNVSEAFAPTPHIDGFATGTNGLTDGKIYNHTVLVGVFLTPVVGKFAGNFTVWPGSHDIYEKHFRERGERAIVEPMPTLEIGKPLQLECRVGDVVLAHYELGHAAAVNISDRDRIAVYFRVWLNQIENNRLHYLMNIWDGWKI